MKAIFLAAAMIGSASVLDASQKPDEILNAPTGEYNIFSTLFGSQALQYRSTHRPPAPVPSPVRQSMETPVGGLDSLHISELPSSPMLCESPTSNREVSSFTSRANIHESPPRLIKTPPASVVSPKAKRMLSPSASSSESSPASSQESSQESSPETSPGEQKGKKTFPSPKRESGS